MQTITSLGGETGSNCGTHVHHNVNDLDRDGLLNLIHNLEMAEHAIHNFVAPARMRGSWARHMSSLEYGVLRDRAYAGRLAIQNLSTRNREYSCGVDRYRCFNFNALLSYGTVEFRAHGCTLNATKLEAWIGVGQAVVEFSRRGMRFEGVQSTTEMLERFVAEGLLHTRLARRFADRVRALPGRGEAALTAVQAVA
jgi:hypothetical protein